MTPIDPNDATQAGRSAMEYWDVIFQLWPIALLGGLAGMGFHHRKVLRFKSRRSRLLYLISEFIFGSMGAVAIALCFPALSSVMPGTLINDIRMELGVCSFLGGCFSQSVLRLIAYKFFGVKVDAFEETPGGCEKCCREKGDIRR